MGEVFRAFDRKLRVHVALKAIRPELAAKGRARDLLRQEVRTAREVVSPNVCRIFDLVWAYGQEFVSMEYIDGTTLAETLEERGPLELRETREIASQLLAGLESIHEAGLVHRDLKPENVMITRTGRVVVMDFGLAKARGVERDGRIAGTPPYMSPEQSRGEPLDPRSDLFAAAVVIAEMLSPDPRPLHWANVREVPPRLTSSPWSNVLGRALSADLEARPESARELARALDEVTVNLPTLDEVLPYPGLASFTENDADLFFGREMEVENLLRKLGHARLLALVGSSGAGKSSFLKAGLVPALPPGWSAAVAIPGHRPFHALARVLGPALDGDAETAELLSRIDEPDAAVALLSRWRQRCEQALLIVDQFEELFTSCSLQVRESFATLLSRIVLEADAHVLLSIRDDFLLHCQSHPGLSPTFSDLTPLGALSRSGLRRALVQPALACGYRFEDEALVDALLNEVRNERGALPLLAFSAARLWELRDREGGILTREAFEHIGGVAGALAHYAEATLAELGRENVPVAREIFRHLVAPQGTRAPREREELLSLFGENRDRADTVLRSLVDARLLTTFEVGDENDGSRQRIEIIHESLLAHWPRLVRWQNQDADSALLRDQLRQAAKLWDERGRPEDLLWTGISYREYALWRERHEGGVTQTEEAFARAMTTLAQRRRRRRRVALAAAFAALLATLTVVGVSRQQAVGASRRAEAEQLLALAQAKLPESSTEALAYVTKSLELADTPHSRLVMLYALAASPPATVIDVWQLHERHRAEHREALPGGELLEEDDVDEWVHGVAFSHDGAWAALEGFEAIQIVSSDGKTWRSLEPFSAGTGSVKAAFDPSGRYLFGAQDGEIRAWSMPEFRLLETQVLPPGRTWIIATKSSAFTATRTTDGAVVVARYDVGRPPVQLGRVRDVSAWRLAPSGQWAGFVRGKEVFVYSLQNWSAGPRTVARHGEPVSGIWFDQGGDRLVAMDASENGTIWSVGPVRKDPLGVLDADGVKFFVFDRDGDRLAGLRDQQAHKEAALWERTPPMAVTPTPLSAEVEELRAGFINGANFTRDGRWLAMGQVSGVVFLPLANVGPRILTDNAPDVRGLDFTSDSRRLVVVGQDGAVTVWDLESGHAKPIAANVPVPGVFGQIEIAPNDEWVVVPAVGGAVILSLEGGPMRRLDGFDPSTWIMEVAIDDAGRRVAAAAFRGPGRDKGVRIWDLHTGDSTFLGPVDGAGDGFDENIYGLEFLPDGRLVSSGRSGVRVWSSKDGTSRAIAESHHISGLEIFGRGRYVVSLMGPETDAHVQITDLETERSRVLSKYGWTRFGPVAADPGERFVVTVGGNEESVAVWPLSGGDPHLVGYGTAESLALSPDGRWIATSDWTDDTLRLWPVPDVSKTPLQALPHEDLLAKLKSLTNVRVVRDRAVPSGWRIAFDPFPGWEAAPTW